MHKPNPKQNNIFKPTFDEDSVERPSAGNNKNRKKPVTGKDQSKVGAQKKEGRVDHFSKSQPDRSSAENSKSRADR